MRDARDRVDHVHRPARAGGRARAYALAGLLSAVALGAAAGTARAVPGPDSVVVVASSGIPESVALAERYVAARQVPRSRLCALELPATDDVSIEVLRDALIEPLRACLGEAMEHVEAVVLVRGVPLRVDVGAGDGCGRASVAAALGAWGSTLADGTPLLGHAPGRTLMCAGGAPCCGARWTNPFRTGVFAPGWSRDTAEGTFRPLLVTMLHGRTYEDAARLIDSAVAAEAPGAARGQMLFMDGADPARGSLDATYDAVIAGLADRGIADVARVPFDPDLTGRTLSAFFVGTASLGTTIEGNDFAPGALVDNLTSFGAVPQNFAPTGESQVSIARWVARGVAGVHGTTDEPLANCFPARRLLLDYVDGGTLAEAYARNMPFVYWQNLVLGDPMAAPYATRPVVRIEGATDGERIVGSRRVEVTATDPDARGPVSIRLWIDGLPVASSEGAPLAHCVAPAADGPVSVLAVAQAADDGTDRGLHRPKGWTSIRLEIAPGDRTCTEATDAGTPIDSGTSAPDASAPSDAGSVLDAGAHDAGGGARDADGRSDAARPADRGDGGCGCRVAPSRGPLDGRGRERARAGGLLLALVGSLVLSRTKRRARAARARQAAGRAA